jgi:hypothetical protein
MLMKSIVATFAVMKLLLLRSVAEHLYVADKIWN